MFRRRSSRQSTSDCSHAKEWPSTGLRISSETGRVSAQVISEQVSLQVALVRCRFTGGGRTVAVAREVFCCVPISFNSLLLTTAAAVKMAQPTMQLTSDAKGQSSDGMAQPTLQPVSVIAIQVVLGQSFFANESKTLVQPQCSGICNLCLQR